MSNSTQNEVAAAMTTLVKKNYIRVSEKLAEKSSEVASQVFKKMKELGISKLVVGSICTLYRYEGTSCECSYSELTFVDNRSAYFNYKRKAGDLLDSKIGEDGNTHSVNRRDCDSAIQALPTRDEIIKFASNITSIMAALDAKQAELTEQCKSALEQL